MSGTRWHGMRVFVLKHVLVTLLPFYSTYASNNFKVITRKYFRYSDVKKMSLSKMV